MIKRYNIPAIKEWSLPKYLKGHILTAIPDMMDPTFREAVIFMIDHNEEGAFGCVFNHLSSSRLSDVLELDKEDLSSIPLYIGGPVQQNLLYAIHSGMKSGTVSEHALGPVNGLYFEPEIEIILDYIEKGRKNHSDFKYRFFAGYSGWGPAQLENELERNTWITMPFDNSVLFTEDQGYETALRKKGGMYWIAAETGVLPSKN